MKITAPKGTRDILPDETFAWQWLERTFQQVCNQYGYQEIRLPTFEQTELFSRGVGDTTDVVQKEMYTFLDKGERSMTLRPEGTAGVVRSFLENGMASWPSPVRLSYNINAFRYENVQKGRYREFHQFGVEAFGAKGPEIDAELITLLALYFNKLGLQETKLQINSIGCPACRELYHQILKQYLGSKLKDLCTTCRQRYDKNPLRILDCKEERCRQATADAPVLLDHLCDGCQDHFNGLKRELDDIELPYTVNPRIVRGLDYYTRTVFEFISEHVGTQGTICGGGRYDGLVKTMGGPETPGIGFALGVERLLMELRAQAIQLPEAPGCDLYLAAAGQTGAAVRKLAWQMRQAGLAVETDLMNRSLKAQMKYAGKNKLPYVMVLGEDEIRQQTAMIRCLETGQEQSVRLDRIEAIAAIVRDQK